MLQTRLRAFPRTCTTLHRRHLSTIPTTSRKPKWGIFSDIHFQQQDLPRIVQTSEWIANVFRAHRVSQIFCLGDVLNTRENVNVQALSATTRFFDALKSIAPVHIVLGNHDMNLKHSGSLSSLDFFDMEEFQESCRLYRGMEKVEIEGVKCLMVPWAENHAKVVERLMELPVSEKKELVLFGHLAVSGAIQQPALSERSRFRTHTGVLKGRHLVDFKGVYLGHFHHHQRLGAGVRVVSADEGGEEEGKEPGMEAEVEAGVETGVETGVEAGGSNVWYVGAPMQHHFGDKADDMRGVAFLEPFANGEGDRATGSGEGGGLVLKFLQNPKWDVFRDVSLQELKSLESEASTETGDNGEDPYCLRRLPFDIRGKRISVRCTAIDAPEYEKWRTRLMKAGAGDVRRAIEVIRRVPTKSEEESSASTETATTDGIEAGEDSSRPPAQVEEPNLQPVEETYRPPTTTTFIQALPAFLNTIPADKLRPEEHRAYISAAAEAMREAEALTTANDSKLNLKTTTEGASSLPIFHATLRSLSISNFFSIQGTLTIPFHELEPGTWFLTGPNGAGKSTILEAIVWCLFGTVLRSDMAAADPVNDIIRKHCCVSIEFENGYKIERFRNFPAKSGGGRGPGLKLYKDGKEVTDFERGEMNRTQEALERDIIGCDFGTFTKSVVFGDEGAGAGNFLSLGSNARRDVLEELLGISNFESYLLTVREKRKGLHERYLGAKSIADSTSHQLQQLQKNSTQQRANLEPKIAWAEELKKNVKLLDEEYARFEQNRAQMEREQGEMWRWSKIYDELLQEGEKMRRLVDALTERKEEVDRARNALAVIQRVKREILPKWEELSCGVQSAKLAIQTAEQDIRRTTDLIRDCDVSIVRFSRRVAEGVCPTCRQPLGDPQHVKAHIEEYKKKKAAAEAKLSTSTTERQQLLSRITDLKSQQQRLLMHAEEGVNEAFLLTLTERERETQRALNRILLPVQSLEREITASQEKTNTLLNGRTLHDIAILAHRDSVVNISALENALATHNEIIAKIQSLSSRRNNLNTQLTKLTTEINITRTTLKEAAEWTSTYTIQLEKSTKQMSELEESIKILSFWENAFNKRQTTTSPYNMRHFLISTSIDELNALIKSNMAILTTPQAQEATGSLSPESTDAFTAPSTTAIDIPLSFTPDLLLDPPSSYGKRSSGQRKRNNLAVLFALFQLIRQKSRFRSEFIMLDEVFDALDHTGQVQASELINSVTAEGDVKHVLVVTHSEGLADEVVKVGGGGASRVMRVVMGERGTEIFDPDELVEHTWTVGDAEIGIPEIETGVTEKKRRIGRRKVEVEVVEEKVEEKVESAEGEAGRQLAEAAKEENGDEEGVVVPKKRGGKRKKKVLAAEYNATTVEDVNASEETTAKRKRRKRKPTENVDLEESSTGEAESTSDATSSSATQVDADAEEATATPQKKKRSKKVKSQPEDEVQQKKKTKKTKKKKSQPEDEVQDEDMVDDVEQGFGGAAP